MNDPRAPIPRPHDALRIELAMLPVVLLAPPAVAGLLLAQARETGDWRAVAYAAVLLVSTTAAAYPLARRARR